MNKFFLVGLTTAVMTSCNPSTQNQKEMKTTERKIGMVEVTTFNLVPGVTQEDFKETALSMQRDFLEKQDGFVKRVLTVAQDSLWTDIVYWQDVQSAEKAMQLAEQTEVVLPFMEKIDVNSVKMNLTTPVLMEE